MKSARSQGFWGDRRVDSEPRPRILMSGVGESELGMLPPISFSFPFRSTYLHIKNGNKNNLLFVSVLVDNFTKWYGHFLKFSFFSFWSA